MGIITRSGDYMMIFRYKARNKDGKLIKDKITGINEADVLMQLHQKEFFILELKKSKLESWNSDAHFSRIFTKKERIRLKELSRFCRQISFMLASGIPLINTLQIILEHKGSEKIYDLSRKLIIHLKEGLSLTGACELEKKKLPTIMIHLIRVGEVGGFLDLAFEQLADYFEKEIKIKNTLKTALTYPLIVCLISFLALIIILGFIIPIFSNMINDVELALPLGTLIILKSSFFLREYGFLLFSCLALSLLALLFYMQSRRGKSLLNQLILKTPLINDFYQKLLTARFCYILAKLLASGIVLLEALDVVEKTIENTVLKKEVILAQENIKRGMTFTKSLEESICLHPIGLQMIAIGENSGNLDLLMKKAGQTFEQEIQVITERLPKLIEPFLIVILGFIVAAIVIGVLMPMFSVIEHIGNI